MANKVSIWITNSKKEHFELTNDRMAIMMACQMDTNWKSVFGREISPYSVIISDFHNSKATSFGLGYSLVEECEDKEIAEEIIAKCREKLHAQYERLMMIRVAKKYHLDAVTRSRIELEYHSSENYEVVIE